MFCGVHFMAESADILTADHQAVILPDLNAGCSMADMADIDEVEEAWEALGAVTDVDRIVPITYMNSSAAIKAFVGRHGGAVCTSTNARAVLEWALGGGPGASGGQGDKVLFFPDQHLGRNTGVAMGYGLDDMRVWDPRRDLGGLTEARLQGGHVPAVAGPLLDPPAVPARADRRLPGRAPRRHRRRAPRGAPRDGAARRPGRLDRLHHPGPRPTPPPGRRSAVGTEVHLVNRLAQEHPDKTVVSLDPLICPCSTMNRIDVPHLAWVLDELVEGRVVNQIHVDADTAEWARVALAADARHHLTETDSDTRAARKSSQVRRPTAPPGARFAPSR